MVRRLWLWPGSLVAVAVVLFGSVNVVSFLGRDARTATTTIDAAGITDLLVDNENGSARIEGGDVDRIQVRAEISEGIRATAHGTRRDGSTLVVHGECPWFLPTWCHVHLVVTVPRSLPVRVREDDGRVTVRHLDGPVDIRAGSGRILVHDVSGDLRVHHGSGRLFATDVRSDVVEVDGVDGRIGLAFTEAPTAVRVDNVNGHVDVTVPPGDAYRVEADSRHGTRRIDVPTDPASSRSIDLRTLSGDTTVRHPGTSP